MEWPAWCSASWRMLVCNAGCGSVLHGVACRCLRQLLRAAGPLSSSSWRSAAAFAIVSSDTTAYASCFEQGCYASLCARPNACCWSPIACVATEGGRMRWKTTSSGACCVVREGKLRQPQPNPVDPCTQATRGCSKERGFSLFHIII